MPSDVARAESAYLTEPAWREIPCRCGHPADYHRDTYHGDPCDHFLCDCGSYDPEDDMLDDTDTIATGIAVIAALAAWCAALILVAWAVSRP